MAVGGAESFRRYRIWLTGAAPRAVDRRAAPGLRLVGHYCRVRGGLPENLADAAPRRSSPGLSNCSRVRRIGGTDRSGVVCGRGFGVRRAGTEESSRRGGRRIGSGSCGKLPRQGRLKRMNGGVGDGLFCDCVTVGAEAVRVSAAMEFCEIWTSSPRPLNHFWKRSLFE
jgi:hypothetical protein